MTVPSEGADELLVPVYARREFGAVPRNELAAEGMGADSAYHLIHDELMLDGNSRMNLATFVTTWMDPEADRLMSESFDKNMVDRDEYRQTAEIERRCVNIIGRLWHADVDASGDVTGTSTVGSSEAAMLGGLAMKVRWRNRAVAAGRDASRPNLVMGINVQVCWEKFCRYWDVEPRLVPMDGDRFHLGIDEAVALCDEDTIGVVAIMGSTYDGSYEPVAALSDALDDLADRTGIDLPIHVDGASGGFVAPFLQPDLLWDFRLRRVASVNASGHKFGLVYPGVGWIVWRDRAALPEDLVFYTDYLGGREPTMAINFSRPGSQVIAQYYNFLRLGFDGYRRVHQACQDVAIGLSHRLAATGAFDLVTDGSDLPVFAFALDASITNATVFDLSERLRDRGWQVPAYTFPRNRTDLSVVRIVCREGFSADLADSLFGDVRRHLDWFARQPRLAPRLHRGSFHH